MEKDELAREYFITKGGAYYRPNAQGYTRSKYEAGRFTLEEAIAHSHPNGPDGPRDGISYELAALRPTSPKADEIREMVERLRVGVSAVDLSHEAATLLESLIPAEPSGEPGE